MEDANSNAALARSLFEVGQTRQQTTPLRARRPDLTLADAYAIQIELNRLHKAAGAEPIGWKIGLASSEFMARVGADSPFWGRAFAGRTFASPATLDLSTWHQAQFEPELALVLGSDLVGPGITREQARAAIHAVRPAFEIVDRRAWVSGIDVIEAAADNGWYAGTVYGPEIAAAGLDLDAVSVIVREGANGATETRGAATILMDGPAGCLAWLANHLVEWGQTLRAGEIVLSGTMTGAHAITSDIATVTYLGLSPEPIEVSVVAR